jgi:hypothetical protein
MVSKLRVHCLCTARGWVIDEDIYLIEVDDILGAAVEVRLYQKNTTGNSLI